MNVTFNAMSILHLATFSPEHHPKSGKICHPQYENCNIYNEKVEQQVHCFKRFRLVVQRVGTSHYESSLHPTLHPTLGRGIFCGAHISLQLILSRSAKRKDPMNVPCMGGCVELQEHSRLDGNRLRISCSRKT